MDKGRGRSRGRGNVQEQQQRPPSARGRGRSGSREGPPASVGDRPGTSVPASQPVASAWGPRAQVQQQHQIRAPAPPQPQMQVGGRATYRESQEQAPGAAAQTTGVVTGGGDVAAMHSGRGALRGRRPIQPTIRTRPENLVSKQGTHGVQVKLIANYFQVLKTPEWCLFQYRVDFDPPEDNTRNKRMYFRRAMMGTLAGYIFDGSLLYSPRRLVPDPMEKFVENEGDGTRFRISIRMVGEVKPGDFHYLQVFNLVMKKCMGHLKLQLVGRDYYDAIAKVSVLEHKLELWPGYKTSMNQYEDAILLCCEVTHKVMRMDTVLHLLHECVNESTADYRRVFLQRIIGAVVLTDYNNRTYRIDDVDFNTTPMSTFPRRDGTSISYNDYYQGRYNLKIADKQQPMLISRAKGREIRAGMAEIIYLVPELCRMTGLTDNQRNNFNLMRALAEHTRIGPPKRIEKLRNFSSRLLSNQQIVEELRQWDLQLANNLVEFGARILPPEDIYAGNDKRYQTDQSADWTRNLRSHSMLHTPNMDSLVVIVPNRLRQSAVSFLQNLSKAAGGMQWRLPQPRIVDIRDDRTGSFLEAIDSVLNASTPTMIMCIVTNNKADRYSAIKKKCCVDRAVPSQVIVARNLESKGVLSIATKVAIQMNCKIGGAPWTVHIPFKTMMVVGFDVCHDSSHKGQSFGAMVASLDPNLTRYYSVVTPHKNDEELSKDIAINMVKAATENAKYNKRLPEKILVYRDGVGDGQIPYVITIEIKQIIEQLNSLYKSHNQDLKLCFIIVSKRINTRFFTERRENPPPGTVVDSCVTLPERYDFFIVSQCVRQGTVSPTSYNIIHDTMGNSPDQLQRMTYKMTHMYYNWSGTVRVPAPCQYAHKLAFLTAQSLHSAPNPNLSKVLFYL